ncbi:MAG: hypothetical protein EBU90_12080 [Proteobacteria bacterium]|nr:hypothetical protein [Pseudomonadota bacterium]NBP14813.1 hypothetical protein [bacterium]
MSTIWDCLIEIEQFLEQKFNTTGTEILEPSMDRFNKPNWVNKVWTSESYRRAHIDVVDARTTKNLWMMHCCIFPHTHNNGPIFGFDVIAGKNKITGCFHDFSPTLDVDHDMIKWFEQLAVDYSWKKTRQLPHWAKSIFSPHMIAAGNVNEDIELNQIIQIITSSTDYYLTHIKDYSMTDANAIVKQNFYCTMQKQNPHTPKVMASLGLDKEDVDVFIQQCLFPEVLEN